MHLDSEGVDWQVQRSPLDVRRLSSVSFSCARVPTIASICGVGAESTSRSAASSERWPMTVSGGASGRMPGFAADWRDELLQADRRVPPPRVGHSPVPASRSV